MTNTNVPLTPAEQEQLSLYALNLLAAPEAQQVAAQLASRPHWQREYLALQEALAQALVFDLPPAAVPEGSAAGLLARVRAETNAGPVPTVPTPSAPLALSAKLPWGGPRAGLAAAAAVAALFAGPLHNTPQRQLQRFTAQAGAVSTPLMSASGAVLGTAVTLPGGRAFVLLSAEAPTGKTYQAWRVVGQQPQSLGLFQGRTFSWALPQPALFAVSIEPLGGSAQPTTSPVLAQRL